MAQSSRSSWSESKLFFLEPWMVWELLKVCPGSAGGSSQLPWHRWSQPGLGSSAEASGEGQSGPEWFCSMNYVWEGTSIAQPQIPGPAAVPYHPQLLLIFKRWAEGSKWIPPWAPSPLSTPTSAFVREEGKKPFAGQSCPVLAVWGCWRVAM